MIAELPVVALAEDNPDDIFFLKRALKSAGVSNPLVILPDGRQVQAYLEGKGDFADRERYPLPSLLLLDLKLPLMSGFQVLEWIRGRAETRSLPVIVLTTSGELKDVSMAYQSGANAFLIKPSGAENLVNQIRAIRDFWLEQNVFAKL